MPTSGFLNQIDTATNKTILPGVIDNVFKNDPTLAYLKSNSLEKWLGGPAIQENFLYQKLLGGPYAKGDSFNINQVQTKTGMTFYPKYYEVACSMFLEDVEVENAGPMAVIKLADTQLQEAALGMSARLAIALYNHGQAIPGDDRSTSLNGLAEAINDGTTNSWNGTPFPVYGTITRNAQVGGALNAPMTFPAANVNGPILYQTLEFSYNTATIGTESPNLGVTTNRGMSYIKLKFQPQQRFETDSPAVGFRGLKFNGAMIMVSQYCPGAAGVNDPQLGNYLASAGETFWWLNTKYIKLFVSTSPMFGFGFSGWKPAQDNNTVAGQYFFAGNLVVTSPRLQYQLYAITG